MLIPNAKHRWSCAQNIAFARAIFDASVGSLAARCSLAAGFCAIMALLAASAAMATSVAAEDLAAFYRNRQIRFVISSEPGGGFDLYGRMISRHMGQHLPGTPAIVPENMPSAGGRTLANWLYNIAPRDGTVLGILQDTSALDQANRLEGVQFDVEKFNWVGGPLVDNKVTFVSASSGIASLNDLLASSKPLYCGDVGGGPTMTYPHFIKNLLHANVKVVGGFPGLASVYLAMERGEVDCIGSTPWASLKSTRAEQFKKKEYNILLQWGSATNPDISAYMGANVPLSTELAHNDLDRQAVDFVNANATLGRPIALPPGVADEKVAAFRAAFDATMKDPEFLAEAEKASLVISPLSGTEIQRLTAVVVRTSSETLQRVRELDTD